MKVFQKTMSLLVSVLIILASVISIYALWDQSKMNSVADSQEISSEISQSDDNEDLANLSKAEISNYKASKTNSSLTAAISINPEVVGWLKVNGTGINYAVARSSTTNAKYINTSIDGVTFSMSGAIYLDYRNAAGFSDFNNVVYGHNMENGKMFGDLKKFDNKDFFKANTKGTLDTPNGSYSFDTIAHIVTLSSDTTVINPKITDRSAWLKTIKNKASQYNNVSADTDDIYLTLVTCKTGAASNTRDVLVVRIKSSSTTPITPIATSPTQANPIQPEDMVKTNFLIPVKKVIKGDTPTSAETFSFKLTAKDKSNPMPSGSKNGVKTVTRKGAGNVDFGDIKFDTPGMYYYSVTENNSKAAGYTYDKTVYKVTIAVLNSGATEYAISTVIQAEGALAKTDCATFTNRYSKSDDPQTPDEPDNPYNPYNPNTPDNPSQPQTDDMTDNMPLTVLFIILAGLFVGTLVRVSIANDIKRK